MTFVQSPIPHTLRISTAPVLCSFIPTGTFAAVADVVLWTIAEGKIPQPSRNGRIPPDEGFTTPNLM